MDDQVNDEVMEQGFVHQLTTFFVLLALGIAAFYFFAPPVLVDKVEKLLWNMIIPVPSDVMIEARVDFDACGREKPILVKYSGLEGNAGTLIKSHNLKAYLTGNPDPIISFPRSTYSIDAELRAGYSFQRCWAFSSGADPAELASLLKYDLENLDWRVDAIYWASSSKKSPPIE